MDRLKRIEIRIIAAFFFVTGLTGLFAFLIKIFTLDNIFIIVMYLIASGLFGLTTYAGYLLFKEKEKGLEIGRAIAAMQIIYFDISGLSYLFTTGIAIMFGLKDSNVGFDFVVQTGFTINLIDEPVNFIFKINLLALGIFLYLSRTINKIQDDQDIQEELEKNKIDLADE
jgi:hypothetical protein